MMMNAHWLVSILCATCAQLTVASQNCTLIDAKLSATFRGEDSDDTFGLLTDLRMRGADDSVLLPGGGSLAAWSASFVGTGTGLARTSSRGTCANRKVLAASGTAASFQWTDCVVTLPPGPPPPPSPGPVVWQQHKQSNCAGRCLPGHSSGPKGGNCQRLPGCGHDAGLPFCEVEAMKAHCLNVSGCTEFNLNGYLYGGSNAAVPFSDYPLECWAIGGGAPTAPARVNVTMDVSLSEGLLEFWITFDADGSLSLWDYTISLSGAKVSATTKTVGTSAARQLTGLYDSAVPAGSAVYFAAHDPTGGVKACGASADSGTGSMHCTVDALDATLPLYQYKAAFPLVVTVVAGDWWDLASVYRRWVTSNAAWTRLGPLSTRTDMPDWLENLTMWMNNNWGGDPLGPNYGGDPEHVKNEMLQVNAALNLTAHGGHLALHWYEWDTLGYALGSNHTQCDRVGAPCGFDTHYPNYFPARVGCKESIKAMQEAGMRVIPYINGQLFDTLISRWQDDNASLATQKFVAQTMKTADKDPPLTPHLEHFDGITSAVMCPHTKYWHDVMSATIQTIVNELGFDGCYVDQVGNGEKRNCGDPSHNHTIHGGSFWAEAFYSIMAEVRAIGKKTK